ncbi:MAG: hypothetical protein HY255_07615 [Betaproteobacteria bacterium]|nr:hypothetical protein [Betaproteobacteria bacterium]
MGSDTIFEHQLWFKSEKFKITDGEDAETNPFCFGKGLANWLRISLAAKGYQTEDVIAEDWGWLVMCARKPFRLWVGCVNVHDYAKGKRCDATPSIEDVVWTCTVVAEQSILRRLFGGVDSTAAVAKLHEDVQVVLAEDAKVTFVEQP